MHVTFFLTITCLYLINSCLLEINTVSVCKCVYFCVVLVPYIMRLSILKVNDQQDLERVYVLHLEWFGGRGGGAR